MSAPMTALRESATVLAKTYTVLVEAFLAEGLDMEDARMEARLMTLYATLAQADEYPEPWEGGS